MSDEHPISWSEIGTFGQCRQKWFWRYDQNLAPKQPMAAPSRGKAGHKALAAYYRGEDWEQALDEWVSEQIEEQELYEEEVVDFREVHDEAVNIMKRYTRKYEGEREEWDVIEVENEFQVPVPGFSFKLKGYVDLIIEDKDGERWVIDHKFPQRSFRKEEQLDLDGQLGLYQYAVNKRMDTAGVLLNQALWKMPTVPSINKNGDVSRARIKSDWATYKKVVEQQGQDPADYRGMKEKLAESKFFDRIRFRRSAGEIERFAADLKRRIWTVRKKNKHIFMNGSNYFDCPHCDYRDLCIEATKGGDVEFLIDQKFEQRKSPTREEGDDDDN